jgi:hypothetical protein
MLRRSIAVVSLIGLSAISSGCSNPELPMSPTSFTSGIILFEHANFLGNSAHITTDVRDLRDFTGPCVHDDGNGSVTRDWNDCVSSVKVAPGWRATIYRGTNFGDDALEVVGDVPNLQLVSGDCDHDGMNDCVSSVRVRQQ